MKKRQIKKWEHFRLKTHLLRHQYALSLGSYIMTHNIKDWYRSLYLRDKCVKRRSYDNYCVSRTTFSDLKM